ncbi:MAG TPA: hypothetical protein VGH33_24365 [Isosphaeraceae bacterium]
MLRPPVERAGKLRPQDLDLTIAAGETREVIVNADDSVEVVPTGR